MVHSEQAGQCTSQNTALPLSGVEEKSKEKNPRHMPSASRGVTKLRARRQCETLAEMHRKRHARPCASFNKEGLWKIYFNN